MLTSSARRLIGSGDDGIDCEKKTVIDNGLACFICYNYVSIHYRNRTFPWYEGEKEQEQLFIVPPEGKNEPKTHFYSSFLF